MDGYIVHGGLDLARGEFLRVEDGRGILLYVWEGALWVTQERDRKDHYVRAGEWLRLDRDGDALAHALARTCVSITAPVATQYARRIVHGEHVLYDRKREPGGWLKRLHVRAFRPTTAAL
jgi:hypothetical protein